MESATTGRWVRLEWSWLLKGRKLAKSVTVWEGTPMESLAVEEKSEWNEVACYLAGSWGS